MSRHARLRGFTLLELLTVVAIIAILSVMLLPVLSKTKGRSKQIACLSQLKQLGLGFINFAHDHGDKFPFQVAMKDGGTLELLQIAQQSGDEVLYAFRHFQAVSNEVNEPKVFVCPSDFRNPAATMREMKNENVSYFLAVTADWSRPDSLLAGDRNISDGESKGSIVKWTSMSKPVWTRAIHEFQGNLLFAGGHVERTGNSGLAVAMRDPAGPISAWIPSASSAPVASSSSGSGGSSSSSGKSQSESERGFSMLQNFFEKSSGTPSAAAPSAPSQSPQQPPSAPNAPAIARRTGGEAAVPEVYASSAPEIKPTNRPPVLASITPSAPLIEDETPVASEVPGSLPEVLALLVEPERCWWCWLLILGACFLVAFVLGFMVYRRRRVRKSEAWAPSWQVPQSPGQR